MVLCLNLYHVLKSTPEQSCDLVPGEWACEEVPPGAHHRMGQREGRGDTEVLQDG